MTLEQLIETTKEFGVWLHFQTNEKTHSSGVRGNTGIAILQHSADVADAIVVLIESRLPGPAFSLARPLLESYVRAFWLLHHATNGQIEAFNSGKCPNFPRLLAAIPNTPETGGAWIHTMIDKNLKAFHDLTHGGMEHVRRRISAGVIEPTYPEKEQKNLIKVTNEIRIFVGAELLSRLNDEKGMRMLSTRAKVLRKLS